MLFFKLQHLKIFKNLKVKFILFLIISMFIQKFLQHIYQCEYKDKIDYKGLRCDYSDENVIL